NYETEKKELEEDAAKMSNTQEVYRAMNHGKIQKQKGSEPIYDSQSGEYYYRYIDINKNNQKIRMLNLARSLKLNIYGNHTEEDNNTIVSIVDESRNILGEVVGLETSEKLKLKYDRQIIDDMIKKNQAFGKTKLKLSNIGYNKDRETFLLRAGATIGYNRLISETRGVVVISKKIDRELLMSFFENAIGNTQSKVFMLRKNRYLYGELGLNKGDSLLTEKEMDEIIGNKIMDIFSKEKMVKGHGHYIAYYPLWNTNGDLEGFFGVASPKEQLMELKMIAFSLIGVITIVIIIITTSVFKKLLENLINPLYDVINASKKIAEGDYDVKIDSDTSGEIKVLVIAYKNMIQKIKKSRNALKKKNDKLFKNNEKLNLIEKITAKVYSEKEFEKSLYYILSTLVFEKGLNYKRAIFYCFDEETNTYNYEMSTRTTKDKFKGNLASFLQLISQFDKTEESKYIDSQFEKTEKNLTLDESDISYLRMENNDIFNIKSEKEGVEKFVIPIQYNDRRYGCIVIEHQKRLGSIPQEDIELVSILKNTLASYIENKQLHEENIKSERLSTIGKMASSIVHEIRTPLVGIKGFADLLNIRVGGKKEKRYINNIKKEVTRLDNLATDLLDYSKGNNYLLEKVAINDIIRNSIEILKSGNFLGNLDLSLDLEPDLYVQGNPDKLKQVFINLIRNALEAIEYDHKKLSIISKTIGKRCEIKLIDNGAGISKTKMKEIFEPFVTTKIQGTGLGLPIVKGIIEKHHGNIEISSRKNKGTTVKIYLNLY
ncbi:MAG: ATP-binding protein, partial [Fusobacteriota bacterium]